MRFSGMLLQSAVVAGVVVMQTGCASIFCGDSKAVQFSSIPTGADVKLVDPTGKVVHQATTPFTVDLRRGRGYFKAADLTAHVTHPTAGSREVPVDNGIEAWYFGNILLGGVIGMLIVDPITGGMYSFPNEVVLDMTLAGKPAEVGASARAE